MDNEQPDLEPRFLQPKNWQWDYFSRDSKKGYMRRIRYGYVLPQDTSPKATLICFPGLGEFGEKFFEMAHWALENKYAFFVIDWVGQGQSTRYLKNPHKRHSAGFDEDVKDATEWIYDHVSTCVKTTDRPIPRVLLAHSMGAHIGIRVIKNSPDLFDAAAFSAPMWGIKAVEKLPRTLAKFLVAKLNTFARKRYAPGSTNWNKLIRAFPGKNIFSSDTARGNVHNAWCMNTPALQVGGVTNGWLYEALKSCRIQHRNKWGESISLPTIVAIAGKDKLVSNRDIRAFAETLPQCKIIDLPNSQHEILMERDEIRDIFLKEFKNLITEAT